MLGGGGQHRQLHRRSDRLPTSIDRIVFTATHDTRAVGESRRLLLGIVGGKARFDVVRSLTNEKAVMMTELYRHSSGWKLGTSGAGFAGGLGALIGHFGGDAHWYYFFPL